MLDYQFQDSQQTLEEGVAEYYSANQQHFSTRKMTAPAQEFFRCHDVAHVVFGCDISLPDEAVVKISSAFGTTIGFGVMKGYQLAESKEVYDGLGLLDILLTTVKSMLLVPKTIWRCSRMRKRWVWSEHSEFLQRPLGELRTEFGICVAHR